MPSQPSIALVTGAANGIGRATAIALARSCAHVHVNYHSDETGAGTTVETIRSAGGNASLLPFDVCDPAACTAAVKQALSKSGRLDILVNNAGIRDDRIFAMMPAPAWQRVVDVNLNGFYNLTKPVIKTMIKQRYGRVISLTSTAGQTGNPGQVNYSAAKAGLIGATRALAREVAARGITVNAVSPGFIETAMLDGLDPGTLAGTIPAGRLGRPEEVAQAIAFLGSDQAAYITGQVLGVNGGLI